MVMTDGEIMRDWSTSYQDMNQVQILADRNLLRRNEMHKHLLRLGLKVKDRSPSTDKLEERLMKQIEEEAAKEAMEEKPQEAPEQQKAEEKPKRKYKTLNHLKALSLYNAGKTDGQIAAEMHVHGSTVSAWRKRNKLPRNMNAAYKELYEEEIRKQQECTAAETQQDEQVPAESAAETQQAVFDIPAKTDENPHMNDEYQVRGFVETVMMDMVFYITDDVKHLIYFQRDSEECVMIIYRGGDRDILTVTGLSLAQINLDVVQRIMWHDAEKIGG